MHVIAMLLALPFAIAPGMLRAADDTAATVPATEEFRTLGPVTVVATRQPRSAARVPAAISAVAGRVPSLYGSARLDWGGPRASFDADYIGAVGVSNAGTDRAGAYAVLDAALGYWFARGRCDMDAFVRVDNLLDRRHAGSVIVNDGNGRYFEPARGRTLLAALTLRWRD